MPFRYEVDQGRIDVVVEGRVTVEDLLAGFRLALGEAEGAGLLIDVTTSDTLPPPDTMEALAGIIGSFSERFGGRVATVVAHPVRYGLARQLGARLAVFGVEGRTFLERDDATSWLSAKAPPGLDATGRSGPSS